MTLGIKKNPSPNQQYSFFMYTAEIKSNYLHTVTIVESPRAGLTGRSFLLERYRTNLIILDDIQLSSQAMKLRIMV